MNELAFEFCIFISLGPIVILLWFAIQEHYRNKAFLKEMQERNRIEASKLFCQQSQHRFNQQKWTEQKEFRSYAQFKKMDIDKIPKVPQNSTVTRGVPFTYTQHMEQIKPEKK